MSVPLYPEEALILAPLSGYTDWAYRRSARRHGCRFAFTEMVDAAALAYARERSQGLLRRGADEEFLGVQLVGRDPEFLKKAVAVLNEYSFDVLDFNLGCPVPKVAKKGAGAVLGREVSAALACFRLLVERSRFPLTAKIRIADAHDPEPTLELCRGLAELGARAITIHGRVREAYYSGPVAWEQIARVREELETVQIIANGGVTDLASYDRLRRETGCKAVMLARGAMGNPWLFEELTLRERFRAPTRTELAHEIELQVDDMIELYGEEAALRLARKILHDYLAGRGYRSVWRARASSLCRRCELAALLREFVAENPGS